MTPRVARLREESFKALPTISVERAVLVTEFYKENYGKFSAPVLRALNFKNLCCKKTIYIGRGELILGERGPFPQGRDPCVFQVNIQAPGLLYGRIFL